MLTDESERFGNAKRKLSQKATLTIVEEIQEAQDMFEKFKRTHLINVI